MELPESIKTLYRHWDRHAQNPNEIRIKPEKVFADPQQFLDIQHFIHERISIWKKKINGNPLPYTNDEILSTYRFCNIFREFDRQTIEFHAMLAPLRNDFALWLMNMFYCRMVARTETVQHVGALSFVEDENKKFYVRLMESPRPRYGTPYVFPVSTIQRSDTPTRELFISRHLPMRMKKIAAEIETWNKMSVQEGVEKIVALFGFNHYFLWTEVLIDVAYQFPDRVDLFKRFPIGPGSMPTMLSIDSKKDPSLLVQELSSVHVDAGLTYNGKPLRLSAENWEGIGCEYRKYTNLKKGVGRRRLFRS
jgi:hypothetical protein